MPEPLAPACSRRMDHHVAAEKASFDMTEQIALYGGTFNPIHNAHLIIARVIAERLELDRVVFLPSARPPHKGTDTLVAPAHRAEMVKLAIQDEPKFEFSDYDLARDGPTYTIDTVMHHRKSWGESARLCWIIGADSLAELITWRRVQALVEACDIITAARPDSQEIPWDQLRHVLTPGQIAKLQSGVLRTPLLEISSTDIRQRVSRGMSIRYMVPDQVRAYIGLHSLYRV